MDKQGTDIAPPEDDDIARLLRAAGRRDQLPAAMKQRWEAQFERELQPVLEKRGAGRRRWVMGLCASLALLVGAIVLTRLPPATMPLEMRISQVTGHTQLLTPGQQPHAAVAGQRLLPGTIIDTGTEGVVALDYGGYNLRLNYQTRLLVSAEALTLESGELYASDYASIAGATQTAQQLRVKTAQAIIRDIGTQFTVIAYPGRTVTTVRRGAVLVDTGREEVRAEPAPGTASRLTVDQALQVEQEEVAPGGEDWNWIYRGNAGFSLEGKTVYDFLQWSVSESGLQLAFASHGAEMLARTTRLHGDIGDLDPEQAVQPVLASTDLVAQRTAGNTLQVTATR